jgi:hypothetical protein
MLIDPGSKLLRDPAGNVNSEYATRGAAFGNDDQPSTLCAEQRIAAVVAACGHRPLVADRAESVD